MHLSVAPAHTLFHFSDKCNTSLLFSLVPPFLFYILLSFLGLSKLHLLYILYFFLLCLCLYSPFLCYLPFKFSHSSLSCPLSLSVCGQSHLIQLHPSVSLHSFSPLCFRLRLHQALTYQCAVILLKSFCGYRLSSKPTNHQLNIIQTVFGGERKKISVGSKNFSASDQNDFFTLGSRIIKSYKTSCHVEAQQSGVQLIIQPSNL